jgi:hypothetical protein
MTKLRVYSSTIYLDGYGAGPHQSLDNPLGAGGEALHEWVVATRTFQQMCGSDGGTTGVDDDFGRADLPTSARGSWAATCSARYTSPGPTRTGKAVGMTTRPITRPSSDQPPTRISNLG